MQTISPIKESGPDVKFKRFDSGLSLQLSLRATRSFGNPHWIVTKGFMYYLSDDESKYVYIPAGYITDLASVPRLFWGLFQPGGEYSQAAVVHDYLCEYLQIWNGNGRTQITRAECDRIFLEAMGVLGVGKMTAKSLYAAVTIYRVVARVSKPQFNPVKYSMEVECRDNFDRYGYYEA